MRCVLLGNKTSLARRPFFFELLLSKINSELKRSRFTAEQLLWHRQKQMYCLYNLFIISILCFHVVFFISIFLYISKPVFMGAPLNIVPKGVLQMFCLD